MAYAQPIVGVTAVVSLTPVVGSSPPTTIIKNSKYKINPKNSVKEAPNTSDGMLRAPGLNDYDGTVEGFVDVSGTAEVNAIESQVVPGGIYLAKFYRSYTGTTPTGPFWSGTIIIGNLEIETGVDDVESWNFPFMKQSGPLVLPNTTSF